VRHEDAGRLEEADAVTSGFEARVLVASKRASLPEVLFHPSVEPRCERSAAFTEIWSGIYARRTAMLWALWLFALLGYYGLTSWLGAMLQQAGYEVTKSVLYTVVISLAGIQR